MFSNFISAIQGAPAVDDEDEDEVVAPEAAGDREPGSQNEESGSSFSIWGMASAMASQMADSMKKQAAEVVTSVQETDWGSELSVFGKTVQSETAELSAKTVKVLEELPDQASTVLPNLGKTVGTDVPDHLQAVGGTLSGLGKDFVEGTREVGGFLKGAYESVGAELDAAFLTGRKATSRDAPSEAETSMRYSRFEFEVSAMQRDSTTYCDEPPDQEDFQKWLETFSIDAKKPDVAQIIADNAFMAELQARIVPNIVDYDVFWTRYFYRLHKLSEQHEQRQRLAQRTTQLHQEEEQVSWDDTYDTNSEGGNSHADVTEGDQNSSVGATVPCSEAREQGAGNGGQQAGVVELVSHPDVGRDRASEPTETAHSGPWVSGQEERGGSIATIAVLPEGPCTGGGPGDEPAGANARSGADADACLETETASDSSSAKGWCVVSSSQGSAAGGGQGAADGPEGTARNEGTDGDLGVVKEGVEDDEEDWGNWE
eukprot:evm.model.scf_51.17 EVM.evm.TU.scf_51.17   scf_51:160962-166991(+)